MLADKLHRRLHAGTYITYKRQYSSPGDRRDFLKQPPHLAKPSSDRLPTFHRVLNPSALGPPSTSQCSSVLSPRIFWVCVFRARIRQDLLVPNPLILNLPSLYLLNLDLRVLNALNLNLLNLNLLNEPSALGPFELEPFEPRCFKLCEPSTETRLEPRRDETRS